MKLPEKKNKLNLPRICRNDTPKTFDYWKTNWTRITFLFRMREKNFTPKCKDLSILKLFQGFIQTFLFFSFFFLARIFSFPLPSLIVFIFLFQLPSFSSSTFHWLFWFCSIVDMRFPNVFSAYGWKCAETSAVQSFDIVNIVRGERLKQRSWKNLFRILASDLRVGCGKFVQ